MRALGNQRLRQGRGPYGAAGRTVLVGEVEAELVPVVLDGLERRVADRAMGQEAAGVEAPGVVLRLAVDDHLRQQPAMTPALAQAGAQAGDAIGVPQPRHGPHQGGAVDRVGDRAVHHLLDARRNERRHPGHGALDDRHDAVRIVGAQVHGEARVDPVEPPGSAILLVEADQQTVALLAGIEVADRAADQRDAVAGVADLRHGLGDEVLVLHRRDGKAVAHHRRDLVATIAARVDDDLGLDLAPWRGERPGAVAALGHGGDRAFAHDLRAGLAGPGEQRVAELCRVDMPVLRVPEAAHDPVGGEERMAPGAFGGVDQLPMLVHALGHRREVAVALHRALVARQPDAAIAVIVAHWMVRVGGEVPVERDGMGLERHHGLVHPEGGHLGGRVPGGPRGDLVALQEDHVAPALRRQVVERRAARDAASDHHHARAAPHPPLPDPPSRPHSRRERRASIRV